MWSSTRSELVLALRASRTRRRQEHDMAVYVAWRTATLMRHKRIPSLTRLLRQRKRRTHQEQERIRADIAAAEAEFARLDAAAARQAADDGG